MVDDRKFPEEGELVLCKVKEILKTTVFVNLEGYSKTDGDKVECYKCKRIFPEKEIKNRT